MGLLQAMSATASGLAAQRIRMDVISGNVANLDTTHAPGGGPYLRHVVRLASGDGSPFQSVVAKFTGQASTGVVMTSVASTRRRRPRRYTTLRTLTPEPMAM